MPPSSRVATSSVANSNKRRQPQSSRLANQPAKRRPAAQAAVSSRGFTNQSSILSFLIPAVKTEDSKESSAKLSVEASTLQQEILISDDEEDAENEVEVTAVTPPAKAEARSDSQPGSPPKPPPLTLPPPPPSKTAKQASLLQFFASNVDESAKRQQQPERQPETDQPRAACGTWPSASRRTSCPPVKWVDGTDLTVDAFNYGAQARSRGYFLSHFHYDHYCGLGRKFDGQLLASRPTAELVRLRLGVQPKYLRPLELQTWYDVPGAKVLLLDANHCPGSAIFLFRLQPSGRQILHTGDFRASPSLIQSIRGWLGESPEIDSLYLDTTYCSPQYDFPPQSDIIDSVLRLVKEFVAENPNYLIVCGSYTLGKERMYLSIARLLGCRAAVDSAKLRLLNALGDSEISSLVGRDDGRCRLQVLPLQTVNHAGLRRYLEAWRRRPDRPRVDACLGISPTGWSLGAKGVAVAPGIKRMYDKAGKADAKSLSEGNFPSVVVYGAAYSEHSSFGELRDFVRSIRPRRILPTVNWHRREACRAMQAHFDSWLRA